ncbi:unnamed protein product [Sphenostylis stenocarpa]|uniref:Uncharacterized protein n=1 Tax=Sphenostylis stenocarpa TaxID=92480 RepID=A0AA86V3A8_9FABA|nr:unnamed protein product [Sphenostylis stenocarpa]
MELWPVVSVSPARIGYHVEKTDYEILRPKLSNGPTFGLLVLALKVKLLTAFTVIGQSLFYKGLPKKTFTEPKSLE